MHKWKIFDLLGHKIIIEKYYVSTLMDAIIDEDYE